jgi:hypothetical protein
MNTTNINNISSISSVNKFNDVSHFGSSDSSSIKQYDNIIDVITMLMILIPLMVVLFIVIAYINNRRVYQVSVSQHQDFPEQSEVTKLSEKLGGIDDKCSDTVRWVYSHRYLDPIYGLCNLDTIEDCYNWVVCMRPGICKQAESDSSNQSDGNVDCSQFKLKCKYLNKSS